MTVLSVLVYCLFLCLGFLASLLVLVHMLIKPKGAKQPKTLRIGRIPGVPILGNALDLSPDRLLERVHEHVVKKGPIIELFALNKRMYLISDIQLCQEMLHKRPKVFRRAVHMDYSGHLMGYTNGLFHTHGQPWNRVRKLVSPPLAKHHVVQNVRQLLVEAQRVVDRIGTKADGKTVVDVKHEMFLFTLHVIIQHAFGLELKGDLAAYFFGNVFCDDVLNGFQFLMESTVFPAPFWLWNLIPYFAGVQRVALEGSARYTSYFQQLIDQKRAELAAHPEATNKHSVIDIMLSREAADNAGGAEATDDEILANVKTFFAAGSETTSVALSWALYFLSQDRPLLAEAQAEVAVFFAADAASLSQEELWAALSPVRMPLCHAIIKESLRLHSPASHNIMQLEQGLESHTLSNGLVILPGDVIFHCFDSIHWDPAYFERPHSFEPKRWWTTDAAALARMEGAFFAFGGGTRACPGQTLALTEAVVGLSAILHHYSFDLACPTSEIRRVKTFTAQPDHMPMTFTKRR